MLRLIAIMLLALLPASPSAGSGTPSPRWQEGEILSRRTILPSHHHTQTRYVYCIRSGGIEYTARFDRPLAMRVYAPVKLSVSRRHILVQDADGSAQKASILVRSLMAIRQ